MFVNKLLLPTAFLGAAISTASACEPSANKDELKKVSIDQVINPKMVKLGKNGYTLVRKPNEEEYESREGLDGLSFRCRIPDRFQITLDDNIIEQLKAGKNLSINLLKPAFEGKSHDCQPVKESAGYQNMVVFSLPAGQEPSCVKFQNSPEFR